MNRLALSRTKVSGSVTLQGIPFTFTASASGTATADRVPEAKKLAVAASNTAATVAARASIDKILADNSEVLSDLEITSLISNNLSTHVVVFRPIAIEKIATTTNGVDFFINKKTTIGSDQWLLVQKGQTLSVFAEFHNYGYVIIRGVVNPDNLPDTALMANDKYGTKAIDFYGGCDNFADYTVMEGAIVNIYNFWTNHPGGRYINMGTTNLRSKGESARSNSEGYMSNYTNTDGNTVIFNHGQFKMKPGSHIDNMGKVYGARIQNLPPFDPNYDNIFCNNSIINSVEGKSYIDNYYNWGGSGTISPNCVLSGSFPNTTCTT